MEAKLMPSQARHPRSFPRSYSRRSFVRWTAAAGAATTVTLAGCQSKRQAQPSSAAAVPKAGGVYKLSQQKDPPSLDPQQSSTSTTMTVAGATMSRLFRYQSDPDPQVAANHTIENDLGLSAESP